MSSESWGELTVAAVALLLMGIAATVEATATLISRHRVRQLAEERGRHRTVQNLLDPRRSLAASLLLVEVPEELPARARNRLGEEDAGVHQALDHDALTPAQLGGQKLGLPVASRSLGVVRLAEEADAFTPQSAHDLLTGRAVDGQALWGGCLASSILALCPGAAMSMRATARERAGWCAACCSQR